MPPRHAYWTIIVGNLPTAFRAAQREELLPTFEQLRRKHPDAVLRWFARGRLWESPEAARERPVRTQNSRSRDWRPGGAHRDPRDRFRKERQARWRAVRERSYLKKSTTGERRGQPTPPPSPQKHERSLEKHEPPPPKHEQPPRRVPDAPKPPSHEKIVVPGRPAERGSRRRDGSKRSGERPPRRGPKRR